LDERRVGEVGGLLAGEEGADLFNGAHQWGTENDGGVLVNADLDRALQVAQLQREGWAIIMSEASASAAAGRDSPSDLRPLLPLGVGLAGHGAVYAWSARSG
jgi:hypothetical protein